MAVTTERHLAFHLHCWQARTNQLITWHYYNHNKSIAEPVITFACARPSLTRGESGMLQDRCLEIYSLVIVAMHHQIVYLWKVIYWFLWKHLMTNLFNLLTIPSIAPTRHQSHRRVYLNFYALIPTIVIKPDLKIIYYKDVKTDGRLHTGVKFGGIPGDLRSPTSNLGSPTSDLGSHTSDVRSPTSSLRPPASLTSGSQFVFIVGAYSCASF